MKNSIGTLENIILEVDFNLNNKKVQIMDVSGKFKCENVKITYMENMPEIKILMLMLLLKTLKFLLM